jgi:hypothetical protein
MSWHRQRILAGIVCIVGVLVSSVLVSAGAAEQAVKKQRIAIEERGADGSTSGTFTLIPLTSGPVKADSGTFTFSATHQATAIRGGQSVTTYQGADRLKGKHGTLRVPNVTKATDAGGGYNAGTATWSLETGTGSYAGLHGGGRGTVVGTPQGSILTRYEGYVSTG